MNTRHNRATKRISPTILTVLVSILSVGPAGADVRLAKVFGSHMVLQRDTEVRVWGWAEPGEQVTVQFADQTPTVTTDKKGKWVVGLSPMKVNATPQELVVTGKNTVKIEDVLIGDVWLCTGQSNMAFGLGGCDAKADVDAADFPSIRFLSYWECFASEPQEDPNMGVWQRVTPQSAPGCTAVGFYFGRKIHKETEVPIGLLESTVGGTEIECWMPQESFKDYPACADIGNRLQEAVDKWRKSLPGAIDALEGWIPQARKALAENLPIPNPPEMPGHPNVDRNHWVRIQSLYNGMIAPITPFAVKGAIWYQGESNGGEEGPYIDKLTAMIGSWRKLWGYEFPFYYVQIANWLAPVDDPSGATGPGQWQNNRMAMLKALDVIPKTGMAVTIDVGDAADIHPKNKFDVGERLALWALKNDYGMKDLVCSGPLYKGMKVEDGKIRIEFNYVGSGLMVGKKEGTNPTIEDKEGKLKQFGIAGEDKKWHWADAVIDGETVVVSSPNVPNPVAVRYAYQINPAGCNLYNKEGLPASPFRTDNW